MAKYTYLEMFKKHPDWYVEFNRIVNHAENYSAELNDRGFFEGVRTMLSIGAGEGVLELREAKRHDLRIGFIDPTAHHVATFEHNIVEEGLQSKCFEIFRGKFEEYAAQRQYDLVIAIHSWYEIGFERPMLEKALACVRPGGKLFITIASRTNLNWMISDREGDFPVSPLHAEGLSDWAKKEKFPHEFFINHRLVDSSLLLVEDNLTQLGKAYASFLTRTPWEDLSSERKGAIRSLVKREVKGGKIDLTSGCLVFSR